MAAAAALLAVLAGTWLRGAEAAKTGWRYVGIQEGVKLYERSVEGRDLPRVRGTLQIRASVFELLAVLDDIDLDAVAPMAGAYLLAALLYWGLRQPPRPPAG